MININQLLQEKTKQVQSAGIATGEIRLIQRRLDALGNVKKL